MSRSVEFNAAARAARPLEDTPQVRTPVHPEGKWAYDRDTGKALSHEEAVDAGDNPEIYKWVEWR